MANVPTLRFPGFTDKWEKKRVGDIAKLSKGAGISKDDRSISGVPCILYGELYTTYNSEIINKVVSKTELPLDNLVQSEGNDVIIPSSGESAIDISTARCITTSGILLGGDLNIIRLKNDDGRFLSYQLNGVRKLDIAKVAQGVSVVHLYGDALKSISVSLPHIDEQKKIADFLSLLDERIALQSKLIEDLKKLKSAIVESLYGLLATKVRLGTIIKQVSIRNRNGSEREIMSVSNKYGFIAQSEQFEERIVASEDTSNYKVIAPEIFAYNPARINVGSIAQYKGDRPCIVSPMYICFECGKQVVGGYLEHFFSTKYFHKEMEKRLEGSVRLCLSFEALCNISISLPPIEQQLKYAQVVGRISDQISIESDILQVYQKQKSYLLSAMFI